MRAYVYIITRVRTLACRACSFWASGLRTHIRYILLTRIKCRGFEVVLFIKISMDAQESKQFSSGKYRDGKRSQWAFGSVVYTALAKGLKRTPRIDDQELDFGVERATSLVSIYLSCYCTQILMGLLYRLGQFMAANHDGFIGISGP